MESAKKFSLPQAETPYRALSALAGLYANAESMCASKNANPDFKKITDSIVHSLAQMYEWTEQTRKVGIDPIKNRLEFVGRTCERFEKLNRFINFWTPMARVFSLLYLCESAWSRSLLRLVSGEKTDQEIMRMIDASNERKRAILELRDHESEENNTILKNYAKPTSLAG